MLLPQRLRQLANEQDGLLTRAQAMECGVSPEAVRHALGDGDHWQKVVPGVYATFTGDLEDRHRVRAALLHAGEEAIVTGSFACRAYGMKYAPPSSVVGLLVPQHVRRAPVHIAKIMRARSVPAARIIRGVPCAPPERAALDAAREADRLVDVRAVLCEVVQRSLTTADRLLTEYRSVDARNMSFARRALDDLAAGCRSAPECELRDLIRSSSVLKEPRWNEPLPDAEDVIPDAYYEADRLAIEVDSIEWHHIGHATELTERRRARYASLGWRVLPISPRRIREEPAAVLAELEAAVSRGHGHAALDDHAVSVLTANTRRQ